jgi:hypothetical protein
MPGENYYIQTAIMAQKIKNVVRYEKKCLVVLTIHTVVRERERE